MMIDLPARGYRNRIYTGSFLRYRPIWIEYDGDEKLVNYPVKCILTRNDIPFEKLRPDKRDLLFISESGELIPYWLETTNSTLISVWLKFSEIFPGKEIFWLYYGNGNFSGLSDGNRVFSFFDDFEDGTIDTNKWTIISGEWIEENGYLKGTGDGSTYERKTIRAEGVCFKNFLAVVIWKVDQEDCLANFIYRAKNTNIWSADRYWARIESRSEYGQGIHMLKSVGGSESDLGNKVPYSEVTTFRSLTIKLYENEHYYEVEGAGSATITDDSVTDEGYFGFQTEKFSTFIQAVGIAEYSPAEVSILT